jgi:hypothetical protein
MKLVAIIKLHTALCSSSSSSSSDSEDDSYSYTVTVVSKCHTVLCSSKHAEQGCSIAAAAAAAAAAAEDTTHKVAQSRDRQHVSHSPLQQQAHQTELQQCSSSLPSASF